MTNADNGSETRYLDLDGDGVPDEGVAHSIAVSRVIVSEG